MSLERRERRLGKLRLKGSDGTFVGSSPSHSVATSCVRRKSRYGGVKAIQVQRPQLRPGMSLGGVQ
jgi:hypothetical protein